MYDDPFNFTNVKLVFIFKATNSPGGILMELGLGEKIALVTGAGGGVGAAVARAFYREGAAVVFTDIDGGGLKRAAGGFGDRAVTIECDVTIKDRVHDLFREVEKRFGRLHILVNCAALNSADFIEDIAEKDIEGVLDVNIKGYMFTTMEAIRLMKKAGYRRLIYINSSSGLKASAGLALYSASKYFDRGFCVAAALELGRFNITANSICPSDIYPESGIDPDGGNAGGGDIPAGSWMNESLLRISLEKEGVSSLGELAAKRTRANPMRRACTKEDVADLALFLASGKAGFVNGQSIGLNGGALPH
jgi:sorbitol-6-phosphate 2-dehydrogenase